METKKIVQSLLAISEDENIIDKLEIAHILEKGTREWEPKTYSEFFFMDNFKTFNTLIIIDKLIHVYIIGDKDKGKSYNVLNIEGNHTDLLSISKGNLISQIKDNIKDSLNQYLPSSPSQRIIYIDKQNNKYVFNREDYNDSFLRKSNWSIGENNYNANTQEYELTFQEIIKECLKDLEETEEQ